MTPPPNYKDKYFSRYTPCFEAESMFCPHCHVLTTMEWMKIHCEITDDHPVSFFSASCFACKQSSIWTKAFCSEKMIYPSTSNAPNAAIDMPFDVYPLYEEARLVYTHSPRAAAALLRVCLEKLCNHIAGTENTIASNLKRLANLPNPLPPRLLQMAQFIRVIGNEAAHPGVIDFEENSDTVNALFEFINLLVENQITFPQKVDSLFQSQPDSIQKKISGEKPS